MIVPSLIPRIALLLLFTVPASGGERPAAHPVELSAPETAARLERCLAASGFDVTRHDTPGAQIRIFASRGDEVRGLLVSPRSPLASVVEWGSNAGEAHAPGTPDDLRACIDRGGAPTEVIAGEKFVVCLRTRREGREIRFSGLLIGTEGTVVSTAHDLDRVEAVSVRLRDGRIVPGTIGRRDPLRDLSRIDLAEPVPGFLLKGRVRDRLTPDEPVYSVGCADSGTVRLREGRVGGTPRKSGGMPLWEVRMETIPGSSGGPAFDAGGNLAGLVKGRFRGTKDQGYLIPVGTILEFLGTVKRGY
ncbi:serine protease [Candidatus Deferrimicrobium sp.]|uniref:S1 family peptidase n=1 Tax=Candidatus Deferrimicrobium sp. TaxID=3060586 RepID=UPI0027244E26|nr:serine protease [Candidatus Deferrimicrobium sp.]MDO8739203.1 serine protease [Candidatus Deferrimicrobium sp.]